MHQLQWSLKTIGQILEGSRKPGQIPRNTLDPVPANIYICMSRSFELSRSASVHEVVGGLLLWLLREMNCSKEQGVMEGWRKCLDLPYMGNSFQVLLSKIPCFTVHPGRGVNKPFVTPFTSIFKALEYPSLPRATKLPNKARQPGCIPT